MAKFSMRWLFVGIAAIGLLTTAVLHPNKWYVFVSCLVMVGLCSFSACRGVLQGRRAPFSIGFAITAAFCYASELPSEALDAIVSPSVFIDNMAEHRRRRIAEDIFTVVVSSMGGIAASYYAFRWSAPEEKKMAKP